MLSEQRCGQNKFTKINNISFRLKSLIKRVRHWLGIILRFLQTGFKISYICIIKEQILSIK